MKNEFVKIVTDLIEIGKRVDTFFANNPNPSDFLCDKNCSECKDHDLIHFISNPLITDVLFKAFTSLKMLSQAADIALEKDEEKQLLNMMSLIQRKYNNLTKQQDDNLQK